jgi:hypothetical protein
MNGHGGLPPCFEHVMFVLNCVALSTFDMSEVDMSD